jgi:hypothetical protein
VVSLTGYELNELVLSIIFVYFLVATLGIVYFIRTVLFDLDWKKTLIKWLMILVVVCVVLYLNVRIGVIFLFIGALIMAIIFNSRGLIKMYLGLIRSG